MAKRKLDQPAMDAMNVRKNTLGKWEALETEIVKWLRDNGDKAITLDRVLLSRAARGDPILATKAAALERWADVHPARENSTKLRWASSKDCDPPFEPLLTSDSVEAYWWMRALVLQAKPGFKEALLVQYSGHWVSALVAALLHRGCDVSLYLCRPSSAQSMRQLVRIQDTFLNGESNFSLYNATGGARLRIYGYDPKDDLPRHALLDAEVWCRGKYMDRNAYDHLGKAEPFIHGHDERCSMFFACEGTDLSTTKSTILAELAKRNADPLHAPIYEYRYPKIVHEATKVDLLLDKALSAFQKKK